METSLGFKFDSLEPLLTSCVAFLFHRDSEPQFPDLENWTVMPTCFTGLSEDRIKLRTWLPYNPEIPLPDIYPRDLKADVHIKTCTQMFREALFIVAKKWK